MNKTVVVNTSPLIFLAKAGFLDFLKAAGKKILVPESVVLEIKHHSKDIATVAIQNHKWLHEIPDLPIPFSVQAWDLGSGESAVLAYAHKSPGSLLIIDDMAGRNCAISMGFAVCGTLGLALRAKREGLISSARKAIEELRRHGLYLTDSVINQALAKIGE